jgi:hypothetical protein
MNNSEIVSNNKSLTQNYNFLLDEEAKIKKLEKDYVTLDAANKESQIAVTEYYSKYIALLFVTLLLVLLLIKYAATGGEQVGGGNNFMNEAIFLLILMTLSIGLAPAIKNLNVHVLLTMFIISYILIKLKLIN